VLLLVKFELKLGQFSSKPRILGLKSAFDPDFLRFFSIKSLLCRRQIVKKLLSLSSKYVMNPAIKHPTHTECHSKIDRNGP